MEPLRPRARGVNERWRGEGRREESRGPRNGAKSATLRRDADGRTTDFRHCNQLHTAMLSHDDTTHSKRRKRESRETRRYRARCPHTSRSRSDIILRPLRCFSGTSPRSRSPLLLSLVCRLLLLLLPLSRFLRSRDANNSPPRFLRVHQQRSQAGLALSFGNGSAGRRNVGGWRRQRAASICQDGGGAQYADRAATIAPHSGPSRTNRERPPWHLAPPWRHAD